MTAVTSYEGDERPHLNLEEDSDETFGRIVAEPLEAGFGITIGNALRRTLLSALPGTAITAVKIEGVEHEFTTIPNMKEDVVEFLLNIKDIRIRGLTDRPGKMFLDVSGEGEIRADRIEQTADYEIVNPELYLATLDSKDARLSIELTVEPGRGYAQAGSTEGLPIGVIPMDAIYSPVRRVNYRVEHTRVGQVTNFDRLILEVWTDGTITPLDAVSNAADILVEQFAFFSRLGRPQPTMVGRGLGSGAALPPDRYNTPIEDLSLSVRAYNCLKRSGLMTVGAVLEKSEEELLALRNFGRKSYDELREKLLSMGFLKPDEDGFDFGSPMGGGMPSRTIVAEPADDDGDELGPVAKALLEALKESGKELPQDDEDEEDEDEEDAK
jgi:DNA-directed RNA polymerase subunit alpha